MNASFPTPVVDNANMFQDDFLIYEGGDIFSTIDSTAGHMRNQQSQEKSGSDCTSQDGGSRDDSSDDAGENGVHNKVDTQSHMQMSNTLSTSPSAAISAANYGMRNVNTAKKRKRNASKSVSEDQKVERRDRNREHAKRSRLRKKSMLKSLQSSLEALQRQNDKIKIALSEKVSNTDQMIQIEMNNQSLRSCENVESLETVLQESQRRFLIRVENDVDLISSLLN